MKIKQMASEIKKQMPKGLNEIETLRYIYIYLGKKKTFSTTYYFGNKQTKKEIYRLSQMLKDDEEFLTEQKDLTCITLATTLKLLAKEFGIKVETVKELTSNCAHTTNEAILKDGRKIYLDLLDDLCFIHTDRRTQNFGDDYTVSYDELKKIDEKIGYKPRNKAYSNEDIEVLCKQTESMKSLDKVRFVLQSDVFNETLQKTDGYLEISDYVKTVLREVTGLFNKVIDCYRDEDINQQPLEKRQYSMCIYAKDNHNNFDIYMFKKKERKFVQLTPERMKRLINQGLKIKETYSTDDLLQRIYGNKHFIEDTYGNGYSL